MNSIVPFYLSLWMFSLENDGYLLLCMRCVLRTSFRPDKPSLRIVYGEGLLILTATALPPQSYRTQEYGLVA